MWILFALLSALCLGFYDVSKKQSLRGNSVAGVLFLSVCCSSLLLLPMLVCSRLELIADGSLFHVPHADTTAHLFILLKAVIVLSSWYFAYIAIKNLPLTIVSPVNATRPMWTLLGALLIFGERLNGWQWAGVTVILLAFFAFSVVGKHEGISFTHNRYIYAMLLAMFLGAASGLYDKYLMKRFDHNAVQVYYTFYQAALMAVFYFSRKAKAESRQTTQTNWSWWIVGISIFLVLSDFFYLLSLTYPDSLIAVVSTTRRCGVIIPFLFGTFVLKDKNPKEKAVCLGFVLLGMLFLLLGTL